MFWKFTEVRKLSTAPFIPVRDGGHRSKFYRMRIELRILPISASIPSENRNTASKRLLICNALRFMFAQENHRFTISQLFSKSLFFIEAIANLRMGEAAAAQLFSDWFNQASFVFLVLT